MDNEDNLCSELCVCACERETERNSVEGTGRGRLLFGPHFRRFRTTELETVPGKQSGHGVWFKALVLGQIIQLRFVSNRIRVKLE